MNKNNEVSFIYSISIFGRFFVFYCKLNVQHGFTIRLKKNATFTQSNTHNAQTYATRNFPYVHACTHDI
jgi:hypothetical protein